VRAAWAEPLAPEWLPVAGQGRLCGVTEPAHQAEEPNLHPGQHDEGGTGGMATRELAAQQLEEQEQQEDDEE
jgi:hypothetical protein